MFEASGLRQSPTAFRHQESLTDHPTSAPGRKVVSWDTWFPNTCSTPEVTSLGSRLYARLRGHRPNLNQRLVQLSSIENGIDVTSGSEGPHFQEMKIARDDVSIESRNLRRDSLTARLLRKLTKPQASLERLSILGQL